MPWIVLGLILYGLIAWASGYTKNAIMTYIAFEFVLNVFGIIDNSPVRRYRNDKESKLVISFVMALINLGVFMWIWNNA